MLTESEAWALLATATFDAEKQTLVLQRDAYTWVVSGLCILILCAGGAKIISVEIQEKMIATIQERPYCGIEGYCWPLTEEGFRQRMAFCRQMDEQTKGNNEHGEESEKDQETL